MQSSLVYCLASLSVIWLCGKLPVKATQSNAKQGKASDFQGHSMRGVELHVQKM